MKKRVSDKTWFPFWVDKWIFGSMRIEFNLEERAIWIDLLALASKDDGYIRGNEETPYPLEQLSGMLMIPQDKLKKAIDKFVKKGKLLRLSNRTIKVAKWDKYQLSRTAKHYAEKGRGEQNNSHSEQKRKAYKIKEEKIIEDNKREKKMDFTKEVLLFFEEEFERYWKEYDKRGKRNKQYAKKRFMALCKKGELAEFDKGFTGYSNFLKDKRNNEGFDQQPKYFSTLVSDYEEYIDFKYKPPM